MQVKTPPVGTQLSPLQHGFDAPQEENVGPAGMQQRPATGGSGTMRRTTTPSQFSGGQHSLGFVQLVLGGLQKPPSPPGPESALQGFEDSQPSMGLPLQSYQLAMHPVDTHCPAAQAPTRWSAAKFVAQSMHEVPQCDGSSAVSQPGVLLQSAQPALH